MTTDECLVENTINIIVKYTIQWAIKDQIQGLKCLYFATATCAQFLLYYFTYLPPKLIIYYTLIE